MFDFFTASECDQYAFYRVPKLLFTDDKFKSVSCEAKLLYGFLLDRLALSLKNKWIDKNGIAFVYYKQETAQENLNIGKNKTIKLFKELEDIGLIIRKKQGQGMPTRVYVMNFARTVSEQDTKKLRKIQSLLNTKAESSASENTEPLIGEFRLPKSQGLDSRNSNLKTSDRKMSRSLKIKPLDSQKEEVLRFENQSHSNTEKNKTEKSNISPSVRKVLNDPSKSEPNSKNDGRNDGKSPSCFECCRKAKEQIDYDALLSQGKEKSYLDLIVSIMAEAYYCFLNNKPVEEIIINGIPLSNFDLISRYEMLDESHIDYILEQISEVSLKKQIKNIRNYVRSCLYNAPLTMDCNIEAQVNFDFGY